MSTEPTTRESQGTYSAGAAGLTVFAAVLMIMVGVFHAAQGLVAIVNDTFYVVGEEYVFQFDVTTWGWIHLLLGILDPGTTVAGVFTRSKTAAAPVDWCRRHLSGGKARAASLMASSRYRATSSH